MSRKEVPWPGLLKAALAGTFTNAEGAGALHLSVRQFIRVKHRFRADGAPGLCHRLRGRPSPRRLPADVRGRVAGSSRPPTSMSMIVMPPRSCTRSRASGSAAPPCGESVAPWTCRPSTAAARASTGPADPGSPDGRPRPARRQPVRCHRMTVSGLTARQPPPSRASRRASRTQNSRSEGRRRGRGAVRWRTAN